jgi:hypothetical protein
MKKKWEKKKSQFLDIQKISEEKAEENLHSALYSVVHYKKGVTIFDMKPVHREVSLLLQDIREHRCATLLRIIQMRGNYAYYI